LIFLYILAQNMQNRNPLYFIKSRII